MLLPKNATLSRLIVDYYHRKYLHAGTRTLRAILAQRYWITSVHQVIRKCLSQCVICCRLRAQSIQPIMGQLPLSRVTRSRPFLNTCADFAGPFTLKESLRRNAKTYKVYFCIFVCLAVKAVHIECVTNLSTDALLAALERFISRRRVCGSLYTDCGTNFFGAARHLKEISSMLSDATIQASLIEIAAIKGIEWHFNPPSAPHFGGLWEAGVKIAKFHLRRVVGTQTLTYEEFATLLCKVEAVMNSRPLAQIFDDPHEEYLTPAHFLIGGSLFATPLDYESRTVTLFRRW